SLSSAASYGSASVDQDGTWHYTVSDSGAVDALAAGQKLDDFFTVQVNDGNGGVASQQVHITITGTNDAAVIGDPTVATVTEDVRGDEGSRIAEGPVAKTGGGQGQAWFQNKETGVKGKHGSRTR